MPISVPIPRRAAPALVSAALLLPAAASAASLTIDDDVISMDECTNRSSEEVSLSWDLGSSSGSTIEILGSDESGCSESDATTAVLVDGIGTSQTYYPQSGDSTLTLADVVSAAGKSPTCSGSDFRVYVCVRLLDASGSEVATASAPIKFQLQRPPPPVNVSTTVGEKALYVSWSAGTATSDTPASSKSYRAFASADGVTYQSAETTGTTARVAGLENGKTYDVWAIAYSESGNASDASGMTTGTPQPVQDFFDLYGEAGGAETGGCSHGGAAGLLALLGAAWATRRRVRLHARGTRR